MASSPLERSITTCQNCRRKKIKCDRSKPSCRKCSDSHLMCLYYVRGHQHTVSFEDNEASSVPDRQDSTCFEPSTTDLSRLHDRIDALQEVVRNLQAVAHDPQNGLSLLSQPSKSALASADQSLSSSKKSCPERPRSSCGFLFRQGGGGQRYVDPSFWAHMCNDASDIEDLLSSQVRYLMPRAENGFRVSHIPSQSARREQATGLERTSHTVDTMHQRHEERPDTTRSRLGLFGDLFAHPPAFSQEQEVTSKVMMSRTDHLLHELPSKIAFDALFEGYLRGYHPIIPVIHAQGLKRRADELYHFLSSESTPAGASLGFVALLYAVSFGGSVAIASSKKTLASMRCESSTELSLHMQHLGVQALRYSNFPRTPTIDSLTAYMILQGTWMRQEEPLSCTAFIGLAVRVATILGLHRDPIHLHIGSPIEAEIRRRVWWHLVHIDTIIALAAGLPPVISLDMWDVRKISDLTEDNMETPAGKEHDDRHGNIRVQAETCSSNCASMASIVGLLVGGKHEASLVLRRCLNDLFGTEPLSGSFECLPQLEGLVQDLHARADRIGHISSRRRVAMSMSEFGPLSTPIVWEDNEILGRWARVYLSALSDWLFALAGSTAVKSGLRERSPDLHRYFLEKCRSYVLKCASIAACPQFDRFHWSWPGNHQPIHALATLLVDLIQDPHSEHAEKYREAVNIVFAMLGPTGGLLPETKLETPGPRPLTEGGEEVWMFIRRLRSKAWRCADIDPGIVWTRKHAVHWLNNLLAEGNVTSPMTTGSRPPQVSQDTSHNGEHAGTPLSNWRQNLDEFDLNTPLPDQSFLANFWNELQ